MSWPSTVTHVLAPCLPVCRSGRLSSLPARSGRAAGKPPQPAAWKGCPTPERGIHAASASLVPRRRQSPSPPQRSPAKRHECRAPQTWGGTHELDSATTAGRPLLCALLTRKWPSARSTRSVLDCGSPLPLLRPGRGGKRQRTGALQGASREPAHISFSSFVERQLGGARVSDPALPSVFGAPGTAGWPRQFPAGLRVPACQCPKRSGGILAPRGWIR